MDRGYEKESFDGLRIKTSVANKFRKYSRSISKSQSMALLAMLEFFEHNRISPDESLAPSIRTLEHLIKKRINGVIAILRDIEKSQTRPTVAMIESLFEQAEPEHKTLLIEKPIDEDVDNPRLPMGEVRFREKPIEDK